MITGIRFCMILTILNSFNCTRESFGVKKHSVKTPSPSFNRNALSPASLSPKHRLIGVDVLNSIWESKGEFRVVSGQLIISKVKRLPLSLSLFFSFSPFSQLSLVYFIENERERPKRIFASFLAF